MLEVSPILARLDKRKIMKEIDADLRVKARVKLKGLREKAKATRKARWVAIVALRAKLKVTRETIRAKIHAIREKALADLREVTRIEREDLKRVLADEIQAAQLLKDEAARSKSEFEAERKYQRGLRRSEAWNKKKERSIVSAHERRSESDDEVRSNLPPDCLAIFNRMPRHFKSKPGMSRSEAVVQYAHDHPTEALDAMVSGAEEKADRMIEEMQERERAAAEAANEVPF